MRAMDVLAEDVIFDSVACPVVVMDAQGTILRANAACLRASGRTRQALVGRCFAELFNAGAGLIGADKSFKFKGPRHNGNDERSRV